MLRGCVGDSVAIVDSATATASSLAELLSVNGLEAPGTTRGTAADAGMAGHEPPNETLAVATHRQLTTGDVAAFRAVAERMFGEEFPDIEAVDLEAAWRERRPGDRPDGAGRARRGRSSAAAGAERSAGGATHSCRPASWSVPRSGPPQPSSAGALERSARRGLIDWKVAERMAVDRVRNDPRER